jgi:hypothetical protein
MKLPEIAEKHGLDYKRVWRIVHKLGLPIERKRRDGRDYPLAEVQQIENALRDRNLIQGYPEYMASMGAVGDQIEEEGKNSNGYYVKFHSGRLLMYALRGIPPVQPIGGKVKVDGSGIMEGRYK